MKVIWKYELEVTDVQRVAMPEGARLLSVQAQGAAPMLWALVDSRAPIADRMIGIVGTGNPAPDDDVDAVYVGSVMCGAFVWHVFDGGERTP